MTMATRVPCEGRTEHHLGCPCHEAKRDAEVAALRAERDRLRADMREALEAAEMLATMERTRAAMDLVDAHRERDEARAERDRLQRACDEGLPREYLECPACHAQHIEGPRHDNPALDGRTRSHHTHRCYHCGHVWDAGRWSFGADVPKPAPDSAALAFARREGAEAMLKRCRAAAREAFDSHPLTLDRYHAPGCICDAIGRGSCSECDRGEAISEALDRLPLDAPTTDGAT